MFNTIMINLLAILFILVIIIYTFICLRANGLTKKQIRNLKYLIIPYVKEEKKKYLKVLQPVIISFLIVISLPEIKSTSMGLLVGLLTIVIVYIVLNTYANVIFKSANILQGFVEQFDFEYFFAAILPVIVLFGSKFIIRTSSKMIYHVGEIVIFGGILIAYFCIHKIILKFIFEKQSFFKKGSKVKEYNFPFVRLVFFVNVLLLYSGKYALAIFGHTNEYMSKEQLLYSVFVDFITININSTSNITLFQAIYNIMFLLSGIIMFSGFLACVLNNLNDNVKSSGVIEK